MTGILNALIAGVSGAVKDTYFNLVSLLLPGNGTDGKQNRTFKDSSVNDFLITPNGNATQGTFSPFSQTGWGNYFNGSSNYRLTIPDSTDLDIAGDFCLELWVYFLSQSASNQLVCIGSENSSQNGFILYNSSSTPSEIILYTNGAAAITTSSAGVTTNRWHHIALVRNGVGAGNTVIYVDGFSRGSAQITTSFTGLAGNGLAIGQTYSGSYVGVCNAYLSNVRLVNGSPVYTGAFTPPTTPLTAITNTKLLTCQSNRFVDANTQVAAKTITVTGSPSVTPFSPFAPTQSYSASAVGGSGYFDGTGDYLDLPSNANLATSSSDFTLECWVYLNSTAGSYIFSGTGATIQISGGSIITYDGSNHTIGTPIANQWCHIAICRSGSTIKAYYNGTESTSWTNSGTQYTHSGARIGAAISTGSQPINGYITNYRLIVGTALYTTSTITVPTSPLTAVTNTQLLLNFTNAGVVDATAKNVLETVGNAQISTTQSKWGGGSVYFDGLNSYLLGASSQQYEFGSGDFTIEAWLNISAAPGDGGIITKGLTGTIDTKIWSLEFVGSGTYPNAVGWYVNAASASFIITGTTNLKSSTWTHVAVCKSGNNTRLFVNGQQEGSTYTTNYTIASGGSLYVGTSFYAPTTRDITGYIDDLRITKFARYTANFPAPTAPFPLQ